MFDALTASDFEPTRTVLLESKPEGWTGSDSIPAKGPPLDSGIAGTVELVHSTSDSLEIKADLPTSRILLVTDGYSRYWKARPLEAGPQSKYEVMPADYAFRAIPLAAGKHHFVIEYKPDGFLAAKAISMANRDWERQGFAFGWRWGSVKRNPPTPKKGEQPARQRPRLTKLALATSKR